MSEKSESSSDSRPAALAFSDNILVSPGDFDNYCVTAPSDPRLPGGGGYQVCGMSDIKPGKFGQVQQVVQPTSDFGKNIRHNDFISIAIDGRFARGARLGGGFDTGRSVDPSQGFNVDYISRENYGAGVTYALSERSSFLIQWLHNNLRYHYSDTATVIPVYRRTSDGFDGTFKIAASRRLSFSVYAGYLKTSSEHSMYNFDSVHGGLTATVRLK